jgi:primosomal protein N' (replication factor Y)
MREELRDGNTSIFSRKLIEGLTDAFANGQQAILFLNRRGYSTFVSCRECGYVMKCPDCGISLTYHKHRGKGICHYCGHEEEIPDVCPECGSRYIRYFGTGTERVEETVNEMFEGVSVARLDMDVMKKKGAMSRILSDFGKGKIDVLTGTQVVAKGLDFRNVGIVGIISADVTLNIPDYRSPERCFQLITQAAGRAGRGDTRGRVIIQTYTPESYAVQSAAEHDYERFFEKENSVREMLGYPPYGDLMQLVISGKDLGAASRNAEAWREGLIDAVGETGISMPQRMTTAAEKEGYKIYILIKCPKGMRTKYMAALEALKEKEKKANAKAGKQFKCQAAVDVNPYSIGRS